MDDNSVNENKNQLIDESQSISTESSEKQPTDTNQPILEVEEISPEVSSPEEEKIGELTTPPPEQPIFIENKSKYFIIGAAVAIFLILLIFFLKILSKKTPKKTIKLVYWGLWEEKTVFEPLIKLYQQKNPHITIDYQKMEPQDYRDRLLIRSQKGTGPDLFRFHNTWLPQIKDILTKIPNNIISNSEFEKTFYPIHQRDLKIGNYYYGIPLEIDGLILISNQDLLKQAGIANPPTNWDEMLDAVSKLTVKDSSGQIITAGVAIGTANNIEHFSEIFGLFLVQNGIDLTKLDQPEAADVLEAYRKFAEPPNDFWNESMPNSIVAFIQEKVAMIITPSWWINNIKAANPDIKIKAVPVPAIPGGKNLSIANYWVEGVSRYSQNQIEAWKFLKFLSEKENLTKIYELEQKTRTVGEPYSRIDLANLLVNDPYLGPVIKQANDFVSLPLITRTFDNGINDEIVYYIENAINMATQGTEYKTAIESLKKGVDQTYEKYKIK